MFSGTLSDETVSIYVDNGNMLHVMTKNGDQTQQLVESAKSNMDALDQFMDYLLSRNLLTPAQRDSLLSVRNEFARNMTPAELTASQNELYSVIGNELIADTRRATAQQKFNAVSLTPNYVLYAGLGVAGLAALYWLGKR